MIILLGLLDIITVLVAFSAVYHSIYSQLAVILLILLGLKGVWTMIVSKASPFFFLGLLDLITAILAVLSVEYGLFTSFTGALLAIIGVKSLVSFMKL